MARIQAVVDEFLVVANASTDISSDTYNELSAINWEDNDKNYPLLLFDKRSVEVAIDKFSRNNLPSRSTYTQTIYFLNTYTETEKASTTLQAKQDALMVIAEQYFAEVRRRNKSGENGFYVGDINAVKPIDETHNDRLIQLSYTVELQVMLTGCSLGSFDYGGLEQPTNLVCSSNSDTSITIGWTDNATAETNYEVWRSADGVTFSLLSTIAADSTSHTDSGLPSETPYAYKVRAIDSTNNGKFSDQILCCTDTPIVAQSGIAYQRPSLTGQTTIYRTGDDGWHLSNGTYDYTPPVYPVSYAQLDTFITLVDNNAFGNKNRFTDENGLQVYTNEYVIDHLTGLGWDFDLDVNTYSWNDTIDNAIASSKYSYTDWRIPNVKEWNSILQLDANLTTTMLNYAPFNMTTILRKSCSTTLPTSTTSCLIWQTVNFGSNLKTNVNKLMYLVRNHY